MEWFKKAFFGLCLVLVGVFVLQFGIASAQGDSTGSIFHLVILVFMWWWLTKVVELPGVKPAFKAIGQLMGFIGKPLRWLVEGLFSPMATGARWAYWWETALFLKSSHTGFVLDGHKKRLSLKHSFQNVLVASPVGAGKTSVVAVPNIYELSRTKASMVIMDVKPAAGDPGIGELYQLTSGYLSGQGYNLRVLNLGDPLRSLAWNPLANLSHDPFKAHNEIQAIANIAINNAAGSGGNRRQGGDPHWNNSAIKHTIMFIGALRALAEQDDRYQRYCHLPGVWDLLNQCRVYPDVRQSELPVVTRFMLQVGLSNPQLSQQYLGALAGSPNSVAGEIGTAITALANLANPAIANLMGSNNFSFTELRQRPTALFITVPIQDLAQQNFGLIVRLFFNQLLDHLRRSQSDNQRPVMLLLDEVGNFTIDAFSDFVGTARSYNVGILAILQSLAQLSARYGHEHAVTIQENLVTKCCFGGTSGVTADYFSQEIGKARFAVPKRDNHITTHREDVLISPSEIANTEKKYLFCSTSDQYPMKFKGKPYFKHPVYKRLTKIPPVPIPETTPPPVPMLDLEQFRPAPTPVVDPNIITTP